MASSGGLHEYADSQFGHCFSWGETREQARENLVVALRELRIRGDFRTIVEHLIMILEKREFRDNSFNTGWLDELIKANEMAEKPDLNLSLICGALNIADDAIQKNFQVCKLLSTTLQFLFLKIIPEFQDKSGERADSACLSAEEHCGCGSDSPRAEI